MQAAQIHDPPTKRRKPQILRDRHTSETNLLIESRIQNTEIKSLAHQIDHERLTALHALELNDLQGVKDALRRQGALISELVKAEGKDDALLDQKADILRIREQDWAPEVNQ